MVATEMNLLDKILRVKNQCNKVRSIQHVLSNRKHSTLAQQAHFDQINSKPKFGTVFTDHMLKMEYDDDRGGWQQPEITKFENISLHPAAKVLHYATTLFEGMKAYRGVDGKIRLFRPLLNLQRLNNSAKRACLLKVNTHNLLKHIEQLIQIDENFIPFTKDGTLYIRPTIVGTDPVLGVSVSTKALLYVILSPCGSYFDDKKKAIRLYADPNYARAWIGGAGDTKMGCNYAPTIYVQQQAAQYGCQQVLWLYGEDEQLTEAGTMAIFAYYINDRGEYELRTPPLNGIILPSITRRSLLELSREWNEFNIVESKITMSEIQKLNDENRLLEFFGVGTACVVCPISEIFYRGKLLQFRTMDQTNPVFERFRKTLLDIQFGRISHPWGHQINTSIDENSIIDNYEMEAVYNIL